ncbi:MAG: ChbG/HpnK family deacetylase [Candidatus Gastranaerophilales bacterium]
MADKKFILSADGFGASKAHNKAVLEGYNNGFLNSASICVNGKAFDIAVNEILPECPNLSVGIQLNLTAGRSLTKSLLLTNKKNKFNNTFFTLLFKSNSSEFLEQAEVELRTQIETLSNYVSIDFITSVASMHSIPNLFEIVAKLAKEYNIAYVRTHYEEVYFISSLRKHLNFRYPFNLIKMFLLNFFTLKNNRMIEKLGLKTNKYIIGVGYADMMDDCAVEQGLKNLEENTLVEAVISPCRYAREIRNSHYKAFLITQNKSLEDKIKRLDFEITNYKKINE